MNIENLRNYFAVFSKAEVAADLLDRQLRAALLGNIYEPLKTSGRLRFDATHLTHPSAVLTLGDHQLNVRKSMDGGGWIAHTLLRGEVYTGSLRYTDHTLNLLFMDFVQEALELQDPA